MKFTDEAFYKTIRDFLTVYLPNQKCYSKNTVRAYRISLNLFLDYLKDTLNVPLHKLSFSHITTKNVSVFLDWLQSERKCGAATRNHRLMAIRSFTRYAAGTNPANIFLQAEMGNVPVQKSPDKMVEFLSEDALKTLLAQPNRNKPIGIRDCFLMTLMYDTAGRCQEILDLKWRDFELDIPNPYVRLTGKPNGKVRTVPLMDKTVQFIYLYAKHYHDVENIKSDSYVFYTIIHGKRNQMSPDNVASFMKKYGKLAKANHSDMPERVHPHQLRHTRAIHLYRNGFPLALLAEYLGHARVETTRVYAYADTEMKRAAIRKADPENLAVQEPAIWEGDDDMIKKLYGLK
jgi:site-specific recombinase XerD